MKASSTRRLCEASTRFRSSRSRSKAATCRWTGRCGTPLPRPAALPRAAVPPQTGAAPRVAPLPAGAAAHAPGPPPAAAAPCSAEPPAVQPAAAPVPPAVPPSPAGQRSCAPRPRTPSAHAPPRADAPTAPSGARRTSARVTTCAWPSRSPKQGRETGQGRYRPGSDKHTVLDQPESSNTYPVPQVMGAAGSWHQMANRPNSLGSSCPEARITGNERGWSGVRMTFAHALDTRAVGRLAALCPSAR